MEKPKIISMIKIAGEWVDQDTLPPEEVRRMVEQTIIRAAANIGFEVTLAKKEKSA